MKYEVSKSGNVLENERVSERVDLNIRSTQNASWLVPEGDFTSSAKLRSL